MKGTGPKIFYKVAAASCFIPAFLFLSIEGIAQSVEKHIFNPGSNKDYYLAVRPQGAVKGVLVLFNFFQDPETVLPETRLHSVAYSNGILTIYASLGENLIADSAAVNRVNAVLKDVIATYSPDTSAFAFAGFGFAGNTVLRYTEMSYERPGNFPVRPKAVFCVASFVDLPGLALWARREIKKNDYQGNVGDAKAIMNTFSVRYGAGEHIMDKLRELTPFDREMDTTGHERFLGKVPVHLYYDSDWVWELKRRHNSLYDNPIADGSELISRLLQEGNPDAELILSKQPGYRNNGIKNPVSPSIVDETDCIQWLMKKLNILNPADPMAWKAPYVFPMPVGWTLERTSFPPPYSPNVAYNGFEEIHFPPGWGNPKTEDYWTVSYLFRLNGKQVISVITLQDFLKVYYDGLIADNVPRRNIPKEKLVPVSARLNKMKPDKGDLETYIGVVSSLDYLAQVPIRLNCKVHVKPGSGLFTPLLVEVSPKPFDHPIWLQMEVTVQQFQCGTKKAD